MSQTIQFHYFQMAKDSFFSHSQSLHQKKLPGDNLAFRKVETAAKLPFVILHRDKVDFFQKQLSHGWLKTHVVDVLRTTIYNKYMLFFKTEVRAVCSPENHNLC